MPFDPSQSYGTVSDTSPLLFVQGGTLYRSDTLASVASEVPFVVTTRGSAAAVRQKLAASAIPFFVAPTGTMAANGAITLGTALTIAYANAYVLLPAGAIAAGSAAGWYFCQMSSTTVGTVFNNIYTSGVPTIPQSPTAFVTTGPGAYTGLTGAQTGIQITVPGGAMGPNGGLIVTALYSNNNSAGTKTQSITFGGSSIEGPQSTTNASINIYREIWNRGVTNIQVSAASGAIFGGAFNGAVNPGAAKDTTVAQTLALSFNNNTATDWAAIEHFNIEVSPG